MSTRGERRLRDDRGYAMAALLVAMTVMAIVMATAMPTWRTMMKREREAELVFRGEQYGRAIALFQRKYGNAMPPNLDVLINEKFLRKKYKDPMTGQDFKIVTPGMPLPGESGLREDQSGGSRGRGQGGQNQPTRQPGFTSVPTAGTGAQPLGGGGVLGVVSTSTETSLRLFNGRDRYDEWVFTPTALSNTAGINPNNPNNTNRPGTGPDGRPLGNVNPFPGGLGAGGAGGNRGSGGRGAQPSGRPAGQQQPARPGGQQQPQAPGPRSPFGGGRSGF
jgi:type II secretory pathway pseudopilin PulG